MGSALLETEFAGTPAQLDGAAPEALKLQVAQRLAAHRDRRERLRPQPGEPSARFSRPSAAGGTYRGNAASPSGGAGEGPAAAAPEAAVRTTPPARAAQIAAAVAERYSQFPSYRALLAAEAERNIQQAKAAAEVAARNADAVAHAQQQMLEAFDAALLADLDQPQYDPTQLSTGGSPNASVDGEPLSSHSVAEGSASLFGEPEYPVHLAEINPATTRRADSKPRRNRLNATAQSYLDPGPQLTTPAAAGLTVCLFGDGAAGQVSPHSLHPITTVAVAGKLSHRQNLQNDSEARALDEEIAFRHAPVFEEPAGPAMPLPANLIEFPRQLVAPRKARPRTAEGPLREDPDVTAIGGSQMRIFEVESAQISTTPEPAETDTPQWASIWLDTANSTAATAAGAAKPPTPILAPRPWELSHLAADLATQTSPRPQAAAIPRRLLAASIDGCIILAGLAAFASAFLLYTGRETLSIAAEPAKVVPALGFTIAFLYLVYQFLFFSFSEATPGMRFARIALCTFADDNPTRPAMRRRILAVMLSACTLGLGFFWAALDKDRLAWHDLISRMYQRSY
jgi:uncharacterized RDD family membrane protein YckC